MTIFYLLHSSRDILGSWPPYYHWHCSGWCCCTHFDLSYSPGLHMHLSFQCQQTRLLHHWWGQDSQPSQHAPLQCITALHLISGSCPHYWWQGAAHWERKWVLCLVHVSNKLFSYIILITTYVHVHLISHHYMQIPLSQSFYTLSMYSCTCTLLKTHGTNALILCYFFVRACMIA